MKKIKTIALVVMPLLGSTLPIYNNSVIKAATIQQPLNSINASGELAPRLNETKEEYEKELI